MRFTRRTMGKAMIAAQLGSLAYGMYKQRKARRTGVGVDGTRLDNGLGGDVDPTGASRRRGSFNPFA